MKNIKARQYQANITNSLPPPPQLQFRDDFVDDDEYQNMHVFLLLRLMA